MGEFADEYSVSRADAIAKAIELLANGDIQARMAQIVIRGRRASRETTGQPGARLRCCAEMHSADSAEPMRCRLRQCGDGESLAVADALDSAQSRIGSGS